MSPIGTGAKIPFLVPLTLWDGSRSILFANEIRCRGGNSSFGHSWGVTLIQRGRIEQGNMISESISILALVLIASGGVD